MRIGIPLPSVVPTVALPRHRNARGIRCGRGCQHAPLRQTVKAAWSSHRYPLTRQRRKIPRRLSGRPGEFRPLCCDGPSPSRRSFATRGHMSSSPLCTKLAVKAREASRLAGISLTTWYNLRASGRLGPQESRVGRAVLYSCTEISDWVAAGFPARERWNALKAQASRR